MKFNEFRWNGGSHCLGTYGPLEQRDVEHQMHRCTCWQIQVIGNLPNLFEDTIGAEELERQLVVGASSNRRLYIGLELEEYQITNIEGTLRAMLVRLPLHT